MGYNGVGGINATPLMAFNTIIDEDISLICYIIKYVRNHDIFDLDKLKKLTMNDIISEIYMRTYDNPLYFLMKNEKDKEFLDQCYKEFKESQEFYDYYIVSTDLFELVQMFIASGEIKPTILCRTDREREIIKDDEVLSHLNVLMLSDCSSSKNLSKYKQFYFYRITDAEGFISDDITYRTYYFSSMGMNLTENKDELIDTKCVEAITKSKSKINIFDMYKSQTIGRAIY